MPNFESTRWSVVAAAGASSDPERRRALTTLCETYWYPLYVFVRRRGYSVEEAEDLTQEFFARLIEKRYLKSVRRERGKFRSFLLAALKHFLANEWDRSRAKKRGGGRTIVSVDFEAAEARQKHEPSTNLTPERLYERRWALALLETVLARLRHEYQASGKGEQFEHLKSLLPGTGGHLPYRELAGRVGMSEGAVRVATHRLRRRYQSILSEEVAQTIADGEEINGEIQYLLSVLSE